jgi:hypothetical protein
MPEDLDSSESICNQASAKTRGPGKRLFGKWRLVIEKGGHKALFLSLKVSHWLTGTAYWISVARGQDSNFAVQAKTGNLFVLLITVG